MRHMRPQKPIQGDLINKQNELAEMNLPLLRSIPNKQNLQKNQYRINIHQNSKHHALKQNKKTYLNLCNKKRKASKLDQAIKQHKLNKIPSKPKIVASTARIPSQKSIVSEVYHSSRGQKFQIKKRKKQNIDQTVTNILYRHRINDKMRAKMIDWLLQIHQAYKLKEKSQRSLSLSELHIIGVTALFIATKYQQIYPLRIKTIYKQIGHYKLPIKEIVDRESEIMECLGFCLKRQCPFLNLEQILFDAQKQNKVRNQSINKISKYFLSLTSYDLDLYYSDRSILAQACILASLRTTQDPFNIELYDSFSTVFGHKAKDYNKIQQLSSKIIVLGANFTSQFGQLENITKIIKQNIKFFPKRMIASCAL